MSRRTKVIIAALFLVLLAIPAIYLVCTWSTDNPLRFQALLLEVDRSPQAATGVGTLHLTVRNISKLPVHLEIAVLSKVQAGGSKGTEIGAILPAVQKRPVLSYSPLYLAAGESMQCLAYIVTDVNSPHVLEDIEVDYRWRSDMAERVHDLWIRYVYDAPAMVRDSVPDLKPFRHRALLEPPAPTSTTALSSP